MTAQLTDAAKAEIIHHCDTVWPLISILPPDPIALARANVYLDQLEDHDAAMYDVVMQMLAKAKGLSSAWRAIRNGQ
ncbi:hypothetical protein [Lentzea albida]|uniref:Uncharacterized protein n=1 Tax=Lentzea albida TaxID=65499 RepID=A0A1H9VHQ3_9PSEU|nr:hypothetical protein [Lentzea albida]SES20747.1 hypothetical protein SAMN04488000_118102 [Lentzea albida]